MDKLRTAGDQEDREKQPETAAEFLAQTGDLEFYRFWTTDHLALLGDPEKDEDDLCYGALNITNRELGEFLVESGDLKAVTEQHNFHSSGFIGLSKDAKNAFWDIAAITAEINRISSPDQQFGVEISYAPEPEHTLCINARSGEVKRGTLIDYVTNPTELDDESEGREIIDLPDEETLALAVLRTRLAQLEDERLAASIQSPTNGQSITPKLKSIKDFLDSYQAK